MIFSRQFKFACPFCRRIYARSLSRVLLGPGNRQCMKCHRTFFDDSIEWPAASRMQKREYLFPERALVYFVANVLFGVGLAFAARPYSHDELAVAMFFAGIALCPLLVRLVLCEFKIRQSMSRYEKALLAQAGYSSGSAVGSWPK
jgi:hypothetical protein